MGMGCKGYLVMEWHPRKYTYTYSAGKPKGTGTGESRYTDL
jgi:hypothetical protein